MNRHINHEQLTALEHHLRLEEREPGTIEKYLRDVRSFAAWLGERPLVKETAALWGGMKAICQRAGVLGHSSIETTRIYLASTGVEYIRCMDRLDLVC